jgi:hypothetical protein
MFSRKLIACVGVIIAALAVTSIGATTPNRTTYFTFSAPVRLPNVTLPAGTYMFELAAPDSATNLVRVSDRLRSKVYLTAFTRLVVRNDRGDLKSVIAFAETAKGTAPPIRAWYPDGERVGREFIY